MMMIKRKSKVLLKVCVISDRINLFQCRGPDSIFILKCLNLNDLPVRGTIFRLLVYEG